MRTQITVIVLMLILVFSTNSFAYTPGETLKSYGAISGDQYGNLNEGMKLNRADMAVLLASLNGKTMEAKNFKLKSTFVDVPSAKWYAPYVAYAEAMEWTHGVGNGKYAPDAYVSVKDTAAFLMNALGKRYSYNTVLTDAKSIGIQNGLSGEGNILRKDVFAAMLDALSVVPEGKDQQLGTLLGYFGEVPTTEELVKVSKIEAASKDSFKVTFSRDVENRSDFSFKVKRFSATVPTTITWNDSKYNATINFGYDLISGIYEVTVLKNDKELSVNSVIVEDRHVESIQITSPTVNVVSTIAGTRGYATYVVYDQYGKDMTEQVLGSDLVFGSSAGVAQGGGGSIIITPHSSIQGFAQNPVVSLSIIDSKKGLTANATLPTMVSISTLTDFKLISIGANIQNGSSTYSYITYQAYDSTGMPTRNYEVIVSGLNDMNYSGISDTTLDLVSVNNSAGIKVEVTRDPSDSSKALIRVTPGNIVLSSDTEVTVSAGTKSGKTSSLVLKILK